MALRARCPGFTLEESETACSSRRKASVPLTCERAARIGDSMLLIGHLLACGSKEMAVNQLAEQSNDGLLPEHRKQRPQFLGPQRRRDRRWRRGGTLATDMTYFLLEYRGLAGTIGPSEAMPRRRL